MLINYVTNRFQFSVDQSLINCIRDLNSLVSIRLIKNGIISVLLAFYRLQGKVMFSEVYVSHSVRSVSLHAIGHRVYIPTYSWARVVLQRQGMYSRGTPPLWIRGINGTIRKTRSPMVPGRSLGLIGTIPALHCSTKISHRLLMEAASKNAPERPFCPEADRRLCEQHC